MNPAFALRRDSADFLRMFKKLLCFFQKCRERWDDVAWKQIAEVKYKAINSKNGEAEAENVDKMHE